MRAIGAKKAQELRAKQHFQQRAKPFFFIRLVAVAAERFAALDRVGDVLGHVAQFRRIPANRFGRRYAR